MTAATSECLVHSIAKRPRRERASWTTVVIASRTPSRIAILLSKRIRLNGTARRQHAMHAMIEANPLRPLPEQRVETTSTNWWHSSGEDVQ